MGNFTFLKSVRQNSNVWKLYRKIEFKNMELIFSEDKF